MHVAFGEHDENPAPSARSTQSLPMFDGCGIVEAKRNQVPFASTTAANRRQPGLRYRCRPCAF